MNQRNTLYFLLLIYILIIASPASAYEKIEGKYCFTYGDKESLIEAKQITHSLAIRNAIESYSAYIISTTNIKNFTLTNDFIQMISSGYMKNIIVKDHTVNGREICETIQATVSPEDIEEAIKIVLYNKQRTIEDQVLESNGEVKILNIRNVNDNDIAVVIKVLINPDFIFGIKKADIFFEFYDKKGNIIGGGKRRVRGGLARGEITTILFPHSEMPADTSYYKVRLEQAGVESSIEGSVSPRSLF